MRQNQSKLPGNKFLQAAFIAEQRLLKAQLDFAAQSIKHSVKLGDEIEQCFIQMLRKYLPQRYAVDGAIIIDSQGTPSQQIDIVIYDPFYTPTLLDHYQHRYVPIEAVYAVFEVKSCITKKAIEYAINKAESVRKLKPTSADIFPLNMPKTQKKPFRILGGILAAKSHWSHGLNPSKLLEFFPVSEQSEMTKPRPLDCGLVISCCHKHNFPCCFDYFPIANDENNENFLYPKSARVSQNENALAVFLFRLLTALQLCGNPPAADWTAYIKEFSK